MRPTLPSELYRRDRYLVLAGGFLGWMFAGMEMGIMPLVSRAVSKDLMGRAYNEAFAGLAPGYDPFIGENQDRITPLITKDRIMVKGRTVARKPPPVAPDTDPTFYPMARLFISSDSLVSPLNVRDPAALVMPPGN